MIRSAVFLAALVARAQAHSVRGGQATEHAHSHAHDHGHSHGHDHRQASSLSGSGGNPYAEGVRFSCGTKDPQTVEEAKAMSLPNNHRELVAKMFGMREEDGGRRLGEYSLGTIQLPEMVFHVITGNDNAGALTDAQLQAQFDYLQENFLPYMNFTTWSRVDHNSNNVFTRGCQTNSVIQSYQQTAAQTDKLNTYFVDCLKDSLFGYAYFPWSYDEDDYRHGVVMDYRTIDDATSCTGGCDGSTGVHEWGHAFGLLHTFSNLAGDPYCDCTWGDLVDDTPPEVEATYGGGNNCASHAQTNTCSEPNDQNDPVNNFMAYSDDPCLTTFTDGQYFRMLYSLARSKPTAVGNALTGHTDCIPGHYKNNEGSCVACPDGTYQDVPNRTSSCKSCPEGSSSQTIGGSDDDYGLGTLRVHVNQCYSLPGESGCNESWLNDAYCDDTNNKQACGWDGGDCCEQCCSASPGSDYNCGDGDTGMSNFAACHDPTCADSNPVTTISHVGSGQCSNFFPDGAPTPAPVSPTPSPTPAPVSPTPAPVSQTSTPTQAPNSLPIFTDSPTSPPAVEEVPSNAPTNAPTDEEPAPSGSPVSAPTDAPVVEEAEAVVSIRIKLDHLTIDPADATAVAEMESSLIRAVYDQLGATTADGIVVTGRLVFTRRAQKKAKRRHLAGGAWFEAEITVSQSYAEANVDDDAAESSLVRAAADQVAANLQDAVDDGGYEDLVETDLAQQIALAGAGGYAGLATPAEATTALSVNPVSEVGPITVSTPSPTAAPTSVPEGTSFFVELIKSNVIYYAIAIFFVFAAIVAIRSLCTSKGGGPGDGEIPASWFGGQAAVAPYQGAGPVGPGGQYQQQPQVVQVQQQYAA